MDDLPDMEGSITPFLPANIVNRAFGNTSFDAGRGCPFSCWFCTIINVQGRKSRSRTADDVEKIVRENLAQDVHSFVIADDNFARNKNWEPIFDRLIYLREVEKINLKCSIQIATGTQNNVPVESLPSQLKDDLKEKWEELKASRLRGPTSK